VYERKKNSTHAHSPSAPHVQNTSQPSCVVGARGVRGRCHCRRQLRRRRLRRILVGCALCCGVRYIRVRRRARRRAASVVSVSAACVRVRVYQLSVAPRVVESSLLLLLLPAPRLRERISFRFFCHPIILYYNIYNIIGVCRSNKII